MVVVWVRLGEELRELCWVVGSLVSVEWKRKKRLGFSVGRGGILVLSGLWLLSLSPGRRKGEEGGVELRLLSAAKEKRGLDLNPPAQAAAAGREGRSRRRAINAPEKPLRC